MSRGEISAAQCWYRDSGRQLLSLLGPIYFMQVMYGRNIWSMILGGDNDLILVKDVTRLQKYKWWRLMRCEQTPRKLISGVIQEGRLEWSSKDVSPQAWILGMSRYFSVRDFPTHLMAVFMNTVFSLLLRKCALLPDGYGHGKQAETNIWPFRMRRRAENRAEHCAGSRSLTTPGQHSDQRSGRGHQGNTRCLVAPILLEGGWSVVGF